MIRPAMSRPAVVLTVLVGLALANGPARAQSTPGLHVMVAYAPAGGKSVALSYLQASVCPAAGGRCRVAVTDARGRFFVPNLARGRYTIKVAWRGKNYSTQVALARGQTRYVRFAISR